MCCFRKSQSSAACQRGGGRSCPSSNSRAVTDSQSELCHRRCVTVARGVREGAGGLGSRHRRRRPGVSSDRNGSGDSASWYAAEVRPFSMLRSRTWGLEFKVDLTRDEISKNKGYTPGILLQTVQVRKILVRELAVSKLGLLGGLALREGHKGAEALRDHLQAADLWRAEGSLGGALTHSTSDVRNATSSRSFSSKRKCLIVSARESL